MRRRTPQSLDRPDLAGLGAFAALAHLILDLLVIVQRLIWGLYIGTMDEEVASAIIRFDKAVTLLRIEKLHCARSQNSFSRPYAAA